MYLTHKNLEQYWIIDIEGDNLDATQLWCVVVRNVRTNETINFTWPNCWAFRDWLAAHPDIYLVGHNALSFDVPTLNRLLGLNFPLSRVIDTLVLSYLYDPKMPNGHSLEAWGVRLKLPKGDFKDFSKFTPEMLEYCIQDVNITLTVFKRLTERMRNRGYSERSCKLEHDIRVVVDKQQKNGFAFDSRAARLLQGKLEGLRAELEGPIRELFPRTLKRQETYKYRTRQDGTPYASYLRHLEQFPRIEFEPSGDEYHVLDWVEFNIGSPVQRIEKLLSLGWKPQQLTPKGNPKVDEESLLDFAKTSKRPEIEAIAQWLVLSGRISMVQTWMNNLKPDGCIHGKVFTCGAGTRRMTHSSPNTANIPKAKESVPYGKECRSLWIARTGRLLVGYDAAGLEMRCFAHYINNPETAKLYVEGDPHQVNADLLNIERDPVKNVFYAFLYGAQDPKLGWTGNTKLVRKKDQREFGKWIREQLVSRTPGLAELVKQINYEGEWLQTIDGGYVRCFAEHARINYKLQSAGAIVMKQASIFLDQEIERRGFDALKVGDIHDEGQLDCAPDCAEEVGKAGVQAIINAGEELGFRVPLSGEYKVGKTWANTH